MNHKAIEQYYERNRPDSPHILGKVLKEFFENFEELTNNPSCAIYTRWGFREEILAHRYDPETNSLKGYGCDSEGMARVTAPNIDIYIRYIQDTNVGYSIGSLETKTHYLIQLEKSPFEGQQHKELLEQTFKSRKPMEATDDYLSSDGVV